MRLQDPDTAESALAAEQADVLTACEPSDSVQVGLKATVIGRLLNFTAKHARTIQSGDRLLYAHELRTLLAEAPLEPEAREKLASLALAGTQLLVVDLHGRGERASSEGKALAQALRGLAGTMDLMEDAGADGVIDVEEADAINACINTVIAGLVSAQHLINARSRMRRQAKRPPSHSTTAPGTA